MSLINDALKKAQKQRTQDTAEPTAGGPVVAGPRVTKRSQPMPAQTLVVIAGCCAALVLLIGLVVFLLRKPSAGPEVAARPASTLPAKSASGSPTPAAVADGTITPPKATATENPPLTVSVPAATPPPEPAPATVAVSVPSATSLPSSAGPNSAPALKPPIEHRVPEARETTSAADEPLRIALPNPQAQATVDAFKVTGIRASSTDPKVLMNDRVFRINDVVERTFNLRLVEVAPDRLTFVDPAGATYVKDF